jgi:hypothetical protein
LSSVSKHFVWRDTGGKDEWGSRVRHYIICKVGHAATPFGEVVCCENFMLEKNQAKVWHLGSACAFHIGFRCGFFRRPINCTWYAIFAMYCPSGVHLHLISSSKSSTRWTEVDGLYKGYMWDPFILIHGLHHRSVFPFSFLEKTQGDKLGGSAIYPTGMPKTYIIPFSHRDYGQRMKKVLRQCRHKGFLGPPMVVVLGAI